jgi:hypothetical protein
MGIIAVSVDCTALNGPGGGLQNIEDRVDLIIDSIKHTVFVDVDLVGGLPRPYPRPTFTKSMLNTIRFKADCFRAENRRVSINKVRALLIACNRRDERALAFDDLQIVKP